MAATIPALLLAALAAGPGAGPGSGGVPETEQTSRAIALYDQGKYAEARPILEALDAGGNADGPLLYRLFFCRAKAGDTAGAKEALERAASALEAEHRARPRLETAFYLANAYQNLDRAAAARSVAAEATAQLESGAWPQPQLAIERFQAGKLHEDQGRTEDAARWYRAALEGFAREGRPYPGPSRWARRYLAQQAFSRADFASAETEYAELVALGEASRTDWIRLATASAKLGHYSSAADAWRQADKADPARGDDPRYASALARLAAGLGSLPASAPDGRPWSRLSRQELEELMLANANRVKEARAKAAPGASPLDASARAALEKAIAEAKPVFVAAGLEYAVRGLPIRETAFGNNYAPMIFHETQWELPPPVD